MRILFSELPSFPSSHLSCWVWRCSAPLKRQTVSYEIFCCGDICPNVNQCTESAPKMPTHPHHHSKYSVTCKQKKDPWCVVAYFCTLESRMPNKITTWHQVIRGAIFFRRQDLAAGWGNLHWLPAFAPPCCISPGRVLAGSALFLPPLSTICLSWPFTLSTGGHPQKEKRGACPKWFIPPSSTPPPGSYVSTREFPSCLAVAMASQRTEFGKSHNFVWGDWRQVSPAKG